PKEALEIYEAFDKVLPRHPLIVKAMAQLKGTAPAAEKKAADLKPSATLARGKSGADVSLLQARLGLKADGNFGPSTVGALRDFQKKHGLPVNGLADAATLAKLNETPAPAQQAAKDGTALPMLVNGAQAGAA